MFLKSMDISLQADVPQIYGHLPTSWCATNLGTSPYKLMFLKSMDTSLQADVPQIFTLTAQSVCPNTGCYYPNLGNMFRAKHIRRWHINLNWKNYLTLPKLMNCFFLLYKNYMEFLFIIHMHTASDTFRKPVSISIENM